MSAFRAFVLAVGGGSVVLTGLTTLGSLLPPLPSPLMAVFVGLGAALGAVAGSRRSPRRPPEPHTTPTKGSIRTRGGFTLPGRVCFVLSEEQTAGLLDAAEMVARQTGGRVGHLRLQAELVEERGPRDTNEGDFRGEVEVPKEFPMVICTGCGKMFEQTIRGRQLCPDCWSLEEYRAMPVKAQGGSAEAPSIDIPVPQMGGQIPDARAVNERFRKAPALSAKFRFLARHPGTTTGQMAKDLGLTRTTVREAIEELANLGLLEVGENGIRLTEFGGKVAEEILPQVAGKDDPQEAS
jgi:hypothetical protein